MKVFLITMLFCSTIFLSFTTKATEKSGTFTHNILKSSTTLKELSILYYGNKSMADEIASWNEISKLDRLKVGQVIKIVNPIYLPTKSGTNKTGLSYKSWLNESEQERTIKYRVNQKEEGFYKVKFSKVKKEVKTYSNKKSRAINIFWNPTKAEIHFNKGEELYFEKKYLSALEEFKRSFKKDSNNIPLYFYQIKIYKILKQEQNVEMIKEKLISNFPELKELPMFKKI